MFGTPSGQQGVSIQDMQWALFAPVKVEQSVKQR